MYNSNVFCVHLVVKIAGWSQLSCSTQWIQNWSIFLNQTVKKQHKATLTSEALTGIHNISQNTMRGGQDLPLSWYICIFKSSPCKCQESKELEVAQEEDHKASEVIFPPYRYLSVKVRVLEGLVLCYWVINGSFRL